MIVGIVVGVGIVCLLFIAAFFIFRRRRRVPMKDDEGKLRSHGANIIIVTSYFEIISGFKKLVCCIHVDQVVC